MGDLVPAGNPGLSGSERDPYLGRDDPSADTEWNDILRRNGILPPSNAQIDTMLREARVALEQEELSVVKKVEGLIAAHSDDLRELEDELEDTDADELLEEYRRQRQRAHDDARSGPQFGSVKFINASEYVRQVNEADESVAVVVHLRETMLEGSLCLLSPSSQVQNVSL